MKKIFWGFFFVCLNFNLNLNDHSLNLLPNFVGWWLIWQGAAELGEESAFFEKSRPFTLALAVYEGILWLGSLLAVLRSSALTTLLGTLGAVVMLYVLWLLVRAVEEMEARRSADLGAALLHRRWKQMLVLQLTVRLLGILANLSNLSVLVVLTIVLTLAHLVVMVAFLLDWHRTAKAYEALTAEPL